MSEQPPKLSHDPLQEAGTITWTSPESAPAMLLSGRISECSEAQLNEFRDRVDITRNVTLVEGDKTPDFASISQGRVWSVAGLPEAQARSVREGSATTSDVSSAARAEVVLPSADSGTEVWVCIPDDDKNVWVSLTNLAAKIGRGAHVEAGRNAKGENAIQFGSRLISGVHFRLTVDNHGNAFFHSTATNPFKLMAVSQEREAAQDTTSGSKHVTDPAERSVNPGDPGGVVSTLGGIAVEGVSTVPPESGPQNEAAPDEAVVESAGEMVGQEYLAKLRQLHAALLGGYAIGGNNPDYIKPVLLRQLDGLLKDYANPAYSENTRQVARLVTVGYALGAQPDYVPEIVENIVNKLYSADYSTGGKTLPAGVEQVVQGAKGGIADMLQNPQDNGQFMGVSFAEDLTKAFAGGAEKGTDDYDKAVRHAEALIAAIQLGRDASADIRGQHATPEEHLARLQMAFRRS